MCQTSTMHVVTVLHSRVFLKGVRIYESRKKAFGYRVFSKVLFSMLIIFF